MKINIQIKSIFGKLLFEFEKEDNTIKETVAEAIKSRANLSGADLSGANLSGADLFGADLFGADLSGADLSGADLSGANLSRADLSGADLFGANLSRANLSGADLSRADLSRADLFGADLSGADLSGADLSGAKGKTLDDLKEVFWIIPEEGSFIAWKKCNNAILKIEIPKEAKRTCNTKNRKCRAEFINVLSIEDMEGNTLTEAQGLRDCNFIYKLGEIRPDSYDDDYFEDCSHGIHFFVTKIEAVKWEM
jgi:uncharacterized protein YjbI with pentapeptide repeats